MPAPDLVMLIRHGEKPADPPAKPPPHGVDIEGRHDAHSLLPLGWQRAGAIAVLFAGDPGAPLARPTAIFAPDYGEQTESHRTTQTVAPLARRLELSVQTPVERGHEPRLVSRFLAVTEGSLLVCWEHHHLPALAQAFAAQVGIATEDLPPQGRFWPEDDFWTILVFARQDDGGYSVASLSEDVLAGDPPRED
ncbi:hypothetical protein [Nocardioides sp. GXZ039]|uniref:hypothetical protein n=1 Tax=Nocardioides sp. GXZ039 TaxID=3136018 RepID=UPI0030F49627